MRFLLFILMLCFLPAQRCLAASLSDSKGSDEEYIFKNVYNSGMSATQVLEMLQRMKKVEQKLTEIESKQSTKACPPGWKVYNGSCFLAFIKPMATWTEARYVCKSLGSDLAIITSAEENTFAYGLIAGELGNLNHVYFGLKKAGDGNFYWVDGSSLTSPFWDSGEPDGSGDCGIFYSGASGPGKWHDSGSCDTKSGYICEMATMK